MLETCPQEPKSFRIPIVKQALPAKARRAALTDRSLVVSVKTSRPETAVLAIDAIKKTGA